MASDEIKFGPASADFGQKHNGSWRTVKVTKVTGPLNTVAYVYQCHLNEDNDGDPRAYGLNHPDPRKVLQKNLHPHDGLGNATSPHQNFGNGSDFTWVGVYSCTPAFGRQNNLDVDDRPELESRRPATWQAPIAAGQPGYFPVVQPAGAPAPGYYVSVAWPPARPQLRPWDQRRYTAAADVAYAVWAEKWGRFDVHHKDFGLAIRNANGVHSPFFFGDTGTTNRVGECSRKLVRTLSPNAYNEDFVSFLVFPGTANSGQGEPTDGAAVEAIKTKLSYFSLAPNINELVLMLALGADHGRVKKLYENGAISDKAREQAAIAYANIRKGLQNAGLSFPSSGPLPAERRPGPQVVPAR